MARVQPRSYQALQSSWFRPLSHLCWLSQSPRSSWRAGLVAWWLVVTAATSWHNLLPGWLIGFSLMAAGMLAVAWALWRIPEEVWHPRSGSDPVGAADQRAPLPRIRGAVVHFAAPTVEYAQVTSN